jgi:large subunit ribosomal protein L6
MYGELERGRAERLASPRAEARSVATMSRIGKKPVVIPSGVQVTLKEGLMAVKGPKGELKRPLPPLAQVKVEKTQIQVERQSDEPPARAQHGLVRALIQNMIDGVTKGFERKLEINGVGYKAEVAGQKLTLNLGYSHPVVFELPKGVGAKVEKNVLTLSGYDREALGQAAAKIRGFRPPEPYKGKGIKYAEEFINRKVGKTGAT